MIESGSLSSKSKTNWSMLLLVALFAASLLGTIFVTYQVLFGGGETQKFNAQLGDLKIDVLKLPPVATLAMNDEEEQANLIATRDAIVSQWSTILSSSVLSELVTEAASQEKAALVDNYVQDFERGLNKMNDAVDDIVNPDSTGAVSIWPITNELNENLDGIISVSSFKSGEATWKPSYIIYPGVLCLLALGLIALASRHYANRRLRQEREANEQNQAAILRLLDELADLADGDLTTTATVSEDFTGAIADSVNFTIDQLRRLVSRINTTAVKVSSAAQGTQQTALHLAEASDHQAQEIAGASAAINEMAVTIDQVSANASESSAVAERSVSIANNGAKVVQNTINGMDTIREQIQDTSKRIKRLGESSQEIGDIVSLINDIADQTNILALNAAIQASMAGDAGRGFAVVADEVQRLAERSAAATKQIEALVKTIQTDTNEAVISMEQTTSQVVNGARLAQDAGVALEEIEGVSANLAELIQNISNAARQQASSAGHISNTMNVIQEITSQTSAGTNATAQSIGELADMALDLRESVAGFTLPDEYTEEVANQDPYADDLPVLGDDFDDADNAGYDAPAEDSMSDDLQEAFNSDGPLSEEDLDMMDEDYDIDLSEVEIDDDEDNAIAR